MNKKVFTLLPIFSLFALASCGGNPTPDPDHEQFEDMTLEEFRNDVSTYFNLTTTTNKYKKAFVVQEGTESFRGMIEDVDSDAAITGTYYFKCYNDATHFATNYHLLNSDNISNIRTTLPLFAYGGVWAYKKGNKGSRLITYVVGDGSSDNFSFLYNSDFAPVKIVELATTTSSININASFTYIF